MRSVTFPQRRSRTRFLSLVTALLVGATALAACGSDSGSDSDSSITIAVGGSSVVLADVVIAMENGYFEDEGVDVTLNYLGVPSGQAAIAGKVDLAYATPTQTLTALAADRPVKTIWSSTLVNTSLTVAVPASSKAQTIMDLSGKRIATYPSGSASYADAKFVSETIVEQGGEPLTIKALGDSTAIQTQLVSGRVDAAMAAGDFFAALVEQGKIRILTDPRDFKDEPEYNFVNSGMFGLEETLKEKTDAVQGVINALAKAADFIVSSPAKETATVLRASKYGDYGHQTLELLTGQLEASKWFLDQDKGCITSAAWSGMLSLAKGFDLPLSGKSLDDDVFSLEAGTDLSFVEATGVTC